MVAGSGTRTRIFLKIARGRQVHTCQRTSWCVISTLAPCAEVDGMALCLATQLQWEKLVLDPWVTAPGFPCSEDQDHVVFNGGASSCGVAGHLHSVLVSSVQECVQLARPLQHSGGRLLV